MKNFVHILCSVALSLAGVAEEACADWDLQYGVQGRSYSPGGVAQASIGHWFLIWGENPMPKLPEIGPPEDGTPSWQFGYIRPAVYFQTAGLMNRATAEIEFFPVSIIGFAIGQGFHSRPNISSQFDCKSVQCHGWLNRTSIRAQMVLGAQGIFTAFVLRKEWVTTTTQGGRPFSEEGMGIVGASGGDQLLTSVWALGYQFHPKWSVGGQVIRGASIQHPNRSLTSVAFLNHFRGNTSYILGAGNYLSDFMKPGFTAVAMITINGLRPIGFL